MASDKFRAQFHHEPFTSKSVVPNSDQSAFMDQLTAPDNWRTAKIPGPPYRHPSAPNMSTNEPSIAAGWMFREFMILLGLDVESDDHLAGTSQRVARMYTELLNGHPFEFTTFPSEGSQMIVVRDIPFVSFCAHHFLPFTGKAHIAYIPGDRIAGLSKLARTVEHLAARPQVQERLTEQIANYLEYQLAPVGVGIKLEARHECMELRGVRSIGAITITSALRGAIDSEPSARAEFLDHIRG